MHKGEVDGKVEHLKKRNYLSQKNLYAKKLEAT